MKEDLQVCHRFPVVTYSDWHIHYQIERLQWWLRDHGQWFEFGEGERRALGELAERYDQSFRDVQDLSGDEVVGAKAVLDFLATSRIDDPLSACRMASALASFHLYDLVFAGKKQEEAEGDPGVLACFKLMHLAYKAMVPGFMTYLERSNARARGMG